MAPTLPPTEQEKIRAEAWKEARRGRKGPEIRADRRRYLKLLRKLSENKRAACRMFGIGGKRYRALERRNRLAIRLAKESSNG